MNTSLFASTLRHQFRGCSFSWPSGERPHSAASLMTHPSLPRPLPLCFFSLPPFFPSTSLFSTLFPDFQLPGAGDSTGTMGWYHWSAPSSLSACCTITGCCSSSVAYCEVRESKTEKKRKQRTRRVERRWGERERKTKCASIQRDRKKDYEIQIFLCSIL